MSGAVGVSLLTIVTGSSGGAVIFLLTNIQMVSYFLYLDFYLPKHTVLIL